MEERQPCGCFSGRPLMWFVVNPMI